MLHKFTGNTKGLLNEREAIAFLNTSRTTMFRLRRNGSLPFYRINRAIRYDLADLKKFLEQSRQDVGEGVKP